LICERCKQQPASVHYTEVINNQKRQMYLCPGCAEEAQRAFDLGAPLNLHNLLAGLMGPGAAKELPEKETEFRCETCGLAGAAFGQSGLLGCGGCYQYFGERLEALLKRIHGSTRHTGKVPQRSRNKYLLIQEVDRLRAQMREAVENEEFERAAALRDAIRDLQQRLA